MPYGTIAIGFNTLVAYFLVFLSNTWGYLFDLGTGSFHWDNGGTGTIVMNGNIPEMTAKGDDIVAALMTIVHNGLVFIAELSTLIRS